MSSLMRLATGALVFAALTLAGLPADAGDRRRGWGHGGWHHHHHHHRGGGHWVHPQYGPSYWAPPPVRYYRPPPVYVAPPIVYPPPVIYYPGYPRYHGPRGGVSLGVQVPLW